MLENVRNEVLILTYWNVNCAEIKLYTHGDTVLILTYWNVNTVKI